MPALPAASKILAVNLGWKVDDDTGAISRLHFRYTGTAPSIANLTSFNADVAASVNTNLKALLVSAVELTSVQTTDLSSPSSAQSTTTESVTGTRSGTKNAPGVATLITHEIARRYRGGKPRTYLPAGVAGDIATSGEWAGAFVTAAQSGWDAFITDVLASANVTLNNFVNVSYYSGFTSAENPVTHRWRNIPTPRATPEVDAIVLSNVKAKIGSQRRRNRKS